MNNNSCAAIKNKAKNFRYACNLIHVCKCLQISNRWFGKANSVLIILSLLLTKISLQIVSWTMYDVVVIGRTKNWENKKMGQQNVVGEQKDGLGKGLM